MKNAKFKYYIFDEAIKIFIVLILIIFIVFLTYIKSDLAKDVTFLIIGAIGGKYLKT